MHLREDQLYTRVIILKFLTDQVLVVHEIFTKDVLLHCLFRLTIAHLEDGFGRRLSLALTEGRLDEIDVDLDELSQGDSESCFLQTVICLEEVEELF